MDEDPWRQKLRLAILNDDRELLSSLADSLSHTARPPESIILLAHTLGGPPGSGDPSAGLKTLLAGVRQHPGDFWINFRIGMSSSLQDVGDPDTAVLHARIAAALRPASRQVRAALGLALLRRARSETAHDEDRTEARICLSWALEGTPDDPIALLGTAISLRMDGKEAMARELVERIINMHPVPARAREMIEKFLK